MHGEHLHDIEQLAIIACKHRDEMREPVTTDVVDLSGTQCR